jgi:hypothetical protein
VIVSIDSLTGQLLPRCRNLILKYYSVEVNAPEDYIRQELRKKINDT